MTFLKVTASLVVVYLYVEATTINLIILNSPGNLAIVAGIAGVGLSLWLVVGAFRLIWRKR